MSNISVIPSITCKVECGTEKGTAFFVDAYRLLTAYHVVGSALNGNSIYVEIEGMGYECELTIVKPGKDIAILKLKDETVSHEHGSLLSMPIEAKTHFRFWGYPNTLIGEAVGQSVKIRVDETYVALKGDFDAYAVFEDEKHLIEYAGFSGSPVYADNDKIIGIVTDILDSHIGFISIKSVEDELKAQGVSTESDYIEFQEIAYGRKECTEKLRKQIALAGNRYKPELDVPNQSLETQFANLYLCDDGLPIDKSDRFQKYDEKVSEFLNRDNRMRYTLLKPGTRYWGNKFGRTSWQWDEVDLKTSKLYDPASGTCYGNQKWSAERVVPDTQEGYDFPLIRYAEVLLNYAEAVYERDDKIENEDLNISLNQVRQRVNASMPALTKEFAQTHGLDMRTEIRRERTVELFNEGFRIDDLKRWKTAENEMPQAMLGIKWKGTQYESWNTPFSLNDDGCIVVETGRQWADKNYLYPLPSDQLQLNPNLGQNPGWK